MESQTSTDETKQITIDVPAERLAEFYAFFSRFLAGGSGRGRGRHHGHHGHHGHGRHGHGHHGHGHHDHGPGHRGHLCGPRRAEDEGEVTESTGGAPVGTTSV